MESNFYFLEVLTYGHHHMIPSEVSDNLGKYLEQINFEWQSHAHVEYNIYLALLLHTFLPEKQQHIFIIKYLLSTFCSMILSCWGLMYSVQLIHWIEMV